MCSLPLPPCLIGVCAHVRSVTLEDAGLDASVSFKAFESNITSAADVFDVGACVRLTLLSIFDIPPVNLFPCIAVV